MGICYSSPCNSAITLSEAWNVDVEDVRQAQTKSNNLFEVFCRAKGITEFKLQKLYFAVSEEQFNKTGIPLPNRSLSRFSFTKWWMTDTHEVAQAAQATLLQILKPNLQACSEIPHEMSFTNFVSNNPKWGSDNKSAFVFFRDHPTVKNKENVLIQRMQLSGNCYIHGPIVAHYYLMCMRETNPSAIDIRMFIIRHLDSEHLSKLITHCGGGSSRNIFQSLVGSRATLLTTGFNAHQNEIHRMLSEHGAGLVTGFQNPDQSSHSGNFVGNVIGSHSMVLVGFRKEGDKEYVLLQNWWGKKQFVECDSEYFCKSGATIYFCKGEISSHSFHTSSAAYDEGNYDNDDQFLEEEN